MRSEGVFLIQHELFVDLVSVECDFVENEVEGRDRQTRHHDYQVEHLEVAPEEGPLSHEGVPFSHVLMAVFPFVEIHDPLPLYVKLRVLDFGDRYLVLRGFLAFAPLKEFEKLA